jgi:oligopeptide transport system substrate-binding protein
MLKQNLGVDVRLFNQEWKVYLDNQRQHNFQLSRAGWIGDYGDPNTFLSMFLSGDPLNHSQFASKAFDDLIGAAAKETDLKKRLAIFGKAEDMILDELPILPIYIYTRVYLKSPAVQGWFANVEDIHPLKFVSIK